LKIFEMKILWLFERYSDWLDSESDTRVREKRSRKERKERDAKVATAAVVPHPVFALPICVTSHLREMRRLPAVSAAAALKRFL
jgi:hypothetical protein